MAQYDITSPDGQKFRITAPDDATQDQIMDYAKRNAPMMAKDKPETTLAQDIGQQGKNLIGGLLRGAGSIGATLAMPFDTKQENIDRRKLLDTNAKDLIGANPDSFLYGGGKFAGELAGTAGAGGLVAKGLGMIPAAAKYAAPLLESIGSSGMTSSGVKGLSGLATRATGGAVAGGSMSALVDPHDAAAGAAVGAVAPAVIQGLGKAGMAAYDAFKGKRPGAGSMLAKALGVSESDLPGVIAALERAPESIVDGSKLTVNQALQHQGANQPGVKMLERIVAGGPGGDVLLKRYADQAAARMGALENNGAQVYQGAAADVSNSTGNKIGAILRTQAGDDRAAARVAWKGEDGLGGVYGRAAKEGVMLQLPIDAMQSAMSPLGRGSVVAAKDARNVMATADDIGHLIIPAMQPLPKATANNSQTLEKAVRSMGGMKGGSGELRDLGIKQSGTTGLINNKTGRSADLMAEEMHRRGFIPDADPATLFDALRNGGGRKLFANDQVESNGMQRLAEAAMGDPPGEQKILQAIPFTEFQRLRRDSGSLATKVSERAGNETEAGVLSEFQGLLAGRADDAAAGNLLAGEHFPQSFADQYNAARSMTRTNAELYKGGNNISSILRKPTGQDYTLGGDEITNKLWHGGAGLVDDVARLKSTLNQNNYQPAMDSLRGHIMTDAASKATAAGDLASALPRYVESRMPGLQEALNPDQLRGLLSVSADIRNADAANNVKGLLGSDTHAKVSRALDGGLLDTPIAKALSNFKGANILRDKAVDMVKSYKGKTIAELMANPKEAAKALADSGFVASADSRTVSLLRESVYRAAPAIGRIGQAQTQ